MELVNGRLVIGIKLYCKLEIGKKNNSKYKFLIPISKPKFHKLIR